MDGDRAIARIVTNHVLDHDFRPTTSADRHRWDAGVELEQSYIASAAMGGAPGTASIRTDFVESHVRPG